MLDIISTGEYPSNMLSNFYPHKFVIDGVEVSSMEGLLQSFKFSDINSQARVCKLHGYDAKSTGMDIDWRGSQTLYWGGVEYDRHSLPYQELLDRVYDELYTQSLDAATALISTNDIELIHSIGNSNPRETILTEREFCSRLMKIRRRITAMELLHY